ARERIREFKQRRSGTHSNSGGLYGCHTHHVKKKTHTLILICYATFYDFALFSYVLLPLHFCI
ncbi:unnamed protein product, partial [Brassica rapa]